MTATALPFPLPAIRTGCLWDLDFLFTQADGVTPLGDFTGVTALAAFVPESEPARAFDSFKFDGDQVVVWPGECRVGLRPTVLDTTGLPPGTYGFELQLLNADGEPFASVLARAPVEQGLPAIVGGARSEGPLGLTGDQVRTILIKPGGIGVALGTGVKGDTGPKGDPGGLMPWQTIAADRLAADTERLVCDTSGGPFTVILPADGGEVCLRGVGEAWADHPLTIAGNGRTIDGGATFSADAAGYELRLTAQGGAWLFTMTFVYGEA